MKEFRDRVAVVTGAASGIGRGMAERFAAEGMKVVLADVEPEALARKTLDAFGGVHIVCNNAGVGGGTGPLWENTLADWNWVMGVNLWGVVHGVRTFLPIMIEQDSEGHVVNTASVAGLINGPLGIYGVTKHAVVSLSECLHSQLQMAGAKIGVSVLCPGWVNTNIADAARNRPPELQNEGGDPVLTPQQETMRQMMEQMLRAGMSPSDVADRVFDAVREGKFYILTHAEMKSVIQTRMQNILDEKNPVFTGLG